MCADQPLRVNFDEYSITRIIKKLKQNSSERKYNLKNIFFAKII